MIARNDTLKGPHRILIVDDEPVVRCFMAYLVRSLGFTAIEATGAADAARTLHEQGPFALLITDLSMPGTGGWDVVGHFRAKHPFSGVLVVSADSEALIEGAVHLPADWIRFLLKPFTPSEFKAAIGAVLACGMETR